LNSLSANSISHDVSTSRDTTAQLSLFYQTVIRNNTDNYNMITFTLTRPVREMKIQGTGKGQNVTNETCDYKMQYNMYKSNLHGWAKNNENTSSKADNYVTTGQSEP
jgi:hypothetical protein